MSNVEYNRGAIRPVECLKQGWELIKDQYWLFFGITFIGLLIGGAVPPGVLLGPILCGMYICYFRKMKKEPISFELLFKGFDFFAQGAITSVLQTLPGLILWLVCYLPLIVIRVMSEMPSIERGGRKPDPWFLFSTFGLEIVVIFLITFISLAIKMFFTFSYPLIVERNMKAIEAIKTSFNAVLGNLRGMIGLLILQTLLGIVGLLACIIGLYFVLPIYYASDAIAYRQVFPEDHAPINTPPPPPQSW